MEIGLLVWNGNGANGKDNIQKYFQELPRFEHIMNTLVAQPIIGDAVSSQLTFIIKVSRTVIYQDYSTKPFQKTFTVTAQGDKWKIASDCSAASGCWMLSF
ncbi:AAEL001125-PA [Aedes aegypti]|uniref:AAEL001125-PA n=1 Tax=Aedes aegypti TaxID=7159 RepID=Q17M57_AEDAE|nr:AAEL001125-PA [Aedes aegypti]